MPTARRSSACGLQVQMVFQNRMHRSIAQQTPLLTEPLAINTDLSATARQRRAQ